MHSNDPIVFTYRPLVDKRQRVTGIRLAVAGGAQPRALARALSEVEGEWPASAVFVSLPDSATAPELTDWVPPEGTVLEVFAQGGHDAAWSAKWNGHRPALCAALNDAPPASGTFEFLSIPVGALGSKQSEALKGACRASPWIALGTDTPRAFQLAMLRGARSAAGWSFLAPPEPGTTKKSLASAVSVLKLIELVNRDADMSELEAIFRQDVVLAYKLVSLVNSASMGLSVEIRSFQHAITILGMKRLKRWLSMLLTLCNQDAAPALAQTALTRATFLDRIGRELGIAEAHDDLFLTGAFSLLDRILGASFEEIFAKVSVSPEVAEAIVARSGTYGPLLKLAEAVEDRPGGNPVGQVEALALEPSAVNRCLVGACAASLATNLGGA